MAAEQSEKLYLKIAQRITTGIGGALQIFLPVILGAVRGAEIRHALWWTWRKEKHSFGTVILCGRNALLEAQIEMKPNGAEWEHSVSVVATPWGEIIGLENKSVYEPEDAMIPTIGKLRRVEASALLRSGRKISLLPSRGILYEGAALIGDVVEFHEDVERFIEDLVSAFDRK